VDRTWRRSTLSDIASKRSRHPNCGVDGPQFKGIFTRNLMRYLTAPRPGYLSFVDKNPDSIRNNDRGAKYSFGLIWSGQFDAARQSSAFDTIVVAAVLSLDH
jgi:hypothetical protein